MIAKLQITRIKDNRHTDTHMVPLHFIQFSTKRIFAHCHRRSIAFGDRMYTHSIQSLRLTWKRVRRRCRSPLLLMMLLFAVWSGHLVNEERQSHMVPFNVISICLLPYLLIQCCSLSARLLMTYDDKLSSVIFLLLLLIFSFYSS